MLNNVLFSFYLLKVTYIFVSFASLLVKHLKETNVVKCN